jgi:predicted RNA binding protein YcfA (HicA-like mRNA interferase family)
MGKVDKFIFKVLRGVSDSNISFEELKSLLIKLGFDVRIRGSHHVFRKEGIEEKINIQKDGSKTKSYQVRQVRNILTKYHLIGEN